MFEPGLTGGYNQRDRLHLGSIMSADAMRFMSLLLQQRTESESPDAWRPSTDIYRTPTGWLVKIELAGVSRDDVELAMRGRTLTVRGRRRDCSLEHGLRQLHMEIAYNRFERQIELPTELTQAAFETDFRDGMLLIRIHREDEA